MTPSAKEPLPSERATEVVKEREKEYGHPGDVYLPAAKMWSVILGVHVDIEQVAMCMIALKLAREMNIPNPDNLTDIAGYANVLEMLWTRADSIGIGEEMTAS